MQGAGSLSDGASASLENLNVLELEERIAKLRAEIQEFDQSELDRQERRAAAARVSRDAPTAGGRGAAGAKRYLVESLRASIEERRQNKSDKSDSSPIAAVVSYRRDVAQFEIASGSTWEDLADRALREFGDLSRDEYIVVEEDYAARRNGDFSKVNFVPRWSPLVPGATVHAVVVPRLRGEEPAKRDAPVLSEVRASSTKSSSVALQLDTASTMKESVRSRSRFPPKRFIPCGCARVYDLVLYALFAALLGAFVGTVPVSSESDASNFAMSLRTAAETPFTHELNGLTSVFRMNFNVTSLDVLKVWMETVLTDFVLLNATVPPPPTSNAAGTLWWGANATWLASSQSYRVAGAVRLRQHRVLSNYSCSLSPVATGFVDACYPDYRLDNTNASSYGPVPAPTASPTAAGTTATPTHAPFLQNETAAPASSLPTPPFTRAPTGLVYYPPGFVWRSAWALGPAHGGAGSVRGTIATYDASGFALDVSAPSAWRPELRRVLREQPWIDAATRSVIVEFTLANPSVVAGARMLAEHTAGGTVYSRFDANPMRLCDSYAACPPALPLEIATCLVVFLGLAGKIAHFIKTHPKQAPAASVEEIGLLIFDACFLVVYLATLGVTAAAFSAMAETRAALDGPPERYVALDGAYHHQSTALRMRSGLVVVAACRVAYHIGLDVVVVRVFGRTACMVVCLAILAVPVIVALVLLVFASAMGSGNLLEVPLTVGVSLNQLIFIVTLGAVANEGDVSYTPLAEMSSAWLQLVSLFLMCVAWIFVAPLVMSLTIRQYTAELQYVLEDKQEEARQMTEKEE